MRKKNRVSKLAYFLENNTSYQPSKFQCSRLSGSNFTEEGWKHLSPVLQRDKKPSALGLISVDSLI